MNALKQAIRGPAAIRWGKSHARIGRRYWKVNDRGAVVRKPLTWSSVTVDRGRDNADRSLSLFQWETTSWTFTIRRTRGCLEFFCRNLDVPSAHAAFLGNSVDSFTEHRSRLLRHRGCSEEPLRVGFCEFSLVSVGSHPPSINR